MTELTVDEFGQWFRANQSRLRSASSRNCADEIGEHLLCVDKRLGIEVANAMGEGVREVIITAFSNPDAFAIVYQLIDQLEVVPGWNFIPLKPPRGFAATVTVNGQSVSATELYFCPINNMTNGFQLLVPQNVAQALEKSGDAEEIAWLIVESGVGEVVASQIQHLEFFNIELASTKHPIAQLQFAVSS